MWSQLLSMTAGGELCNKEMEGLNEQLQIILRHKQNTVALDEQLHTIAENVIVQLKLILTSDIATGSLNENIEVQHTNITNCTIL